MNKRNINIIISIFLIFLAVSLYMDTADFSASSIVTTGIYIKFLAIFLCICSIIELFKSFFISKEDSFKISKNPKNFIILTVLLVFYVWIMGYIGFIVSTLVFLPFTIFLMGYKKVLNLIACSVGITVFVYFLFVKVFEIPLPENIIF